MFGKKQILKELEELTVNQKEMKQRVTLLESEVKRLVAILDFLSYQKKVEDKETNSTFPELVDIEDIKTSDNFVNKLEELSRIEFATKEDINRIDSRFLEIFNTISSLFKAIPKGSDCNKTEDASSL